MIINRNRPFGGFQAADFFRDAIGQLTPQLGIAAAANAEERYEPADAALELRIFSPDDAVFDVVSTHAPAPQNPNFGTKKLVIRLSGKVTRTRIEVGFR